MMAAMQHIRRTPRDWDMIELRWVADDGLQGGKTARALRVAGMLSEKREYQNDVDRRGARNLGQFRGAKSRSLRHQFRRQLRTRSKRERRIHPSSSGSGARRRRRPALGPVRDVRGIAASELAIGRDQRQHAHARSRARLLSRRPRGRGPAGYGRCQRAVCSKADPRRFSTAIIATECRCLRTGFDPSLGEHGFGSAIFSDRSRTASTAATSSSTSDQANASTNAGCEREPNRPTASPTRRSTPGDRKR